jgi:hypothetical protein
MKKSETEHHLKLVRAAEPLLPTQGVTPSLCARHLVEVPAHALSPSLGVAFAAFRSATRGNGPTADPEVLPVAGARDTYLT